MPSNEAAVEPLHRAAIPGSRCGTPVTSFLDPNLAKTPVSVPLDDSVGLDETPTGRLALDFKFYCPICFRSYKKALATQCCSNTVCEGCARSVVQQAAMHAPINVLVQNADTSIDVGDCFADDEGVLSPISMVACPFCCGNMRLKRLTGAPIRSYKDSPAMTAKQPPHHSQSPYAFRSPARTGDTYEQLRRRVKPLEALPSNLPLSQKSGYTGTPRVPSEMPPRPPPRSVYGPTTGQRTSELPTRRSDGSVGAYRSSSRPAPSSRGMVIESAVPLASDRSKKDESKAKEDAAKKKRSCCIS
jgi:hypothetical protein